MNKKGFTYIELLITLAIVAVLFVPVMQLFSRSLHSTSVSQDLITATNLAKWEMERTKNLNVTKLQLKEMGNIMYPALDEEALKMNRAQWRIEREIIQESDPLEVRVNVFREGQFDKAVVTLVTLIEDTSWEEVRPAE